MLGETLHDPVLIVWDEPKRETNLRNHGVDFIAVSEGFDFAGADVSASYGGRFKATASLGDALLTLVFLLLGTEGISLISARPASKKERRAYDNR